MLLAPTYEQLDLRSVLLVHAALQLGSAVPNCQVELRHLRRQHASRSARATVVKLCLELCGGQHGAGCGSGGSRKVEAGGRDRAEKGGGSCRTGGVQAAAGWARAAVQGGARA